MPNIKVILDCHHAVTIPHTSHNPEYYCRMHGIRPVAERWEKEWRAVCLTCQWSRWCGDLGELNASREARQHLWRGRQDHNVVTLHDSKIKPLTRKALVKMHSVESRDMLDLFSNPEAEPLPPPF